ncbi:hypothetical protein [Allomesorhizobium camelthorni]|uniref:hypothetical protein n=1 Tax=Allomesorhizobium camelthorni TaxID=475069 RepID=UPI001FE796CE|nr:hypothetical protein [Mesorhizobium camelthorni]
MASAKVVVVHYEHADWKSFGHRGRVVRRRPHVSLFRHAFDVRRAWDAEWA